MPILNQPSISTGQPNWTQFGHGSTGTSTSAQSGASRSRPILLTPGAEDVGQDFQQLQGAVDTNNLQKQAVGTQESLGRTLQGLLAQANTQGRQRINDGFQGAADIATNRLSGRGGVSDARLQEDAQRATSRAGNLEIGDLTERLLGREVQGEKEVGKNIADLLFGSGDQATDLINALLGSSGIGNLSQSVSQSESTSRNGNM